MRVIPLPIIMNSLGIDTMIKHNVTIPREFMMIGRGITLIEDIGYNLNPNFNAAEALESLSKKMVRHKFAPGNIAKGSYNYLWMLNT